MCVLLWIKMVARWHDDYLHLALFTHLNHVLIIHGKKAHKRTLLGLVKVRFTDGAMLLKFSFVLGSSPAATAASFARWEKKIH